MVTKKSVPQIFLCPRACVQVSISKISMLRGALFAACFLQVPVALALAPGETASPEPRALLSSTTNKTDLGTALDAWCTSKAAATITYGDINAWDTSAVTDMEDLIYDMTCASTFNDEIGSWDTSSVTTMDEMFYDAEQFNQPLTWNTAKVTTMYYMFYYALEFNSALSFQTESVTDMEGMFEETYKFNQPLDFDDTSKVGDMEYMFAYAYQFNQPLDFNTESVTTMYEMFYDAYSFNQPLDFNTKSVTSMEAMFQYAYDFNQPLDFNTSMVENFEEMFQYAYKFNQDLSAFDTSSATTMYEMFEWAIRFNQDLSSWDVSNVNTFKGMFEDTFAYNQVLCWSIPSGATTSDFFYISSGSVNETAAKCACVANEYYNGAACVPCPSGFISYGKTQSCVVEPSPPSPTPAPSPFPSTPPPTATDMLSFGVSLEMTSSAEPTTEDEADLKDLVADAMEVEASNIKSFSVTWAASGRRRRRLLAVYTWAVSFTVSVALSTTDYSTDASFASFIEEALTSDSFTSVVSTTVGATVDTSSIKVDHDGENSDSGLATAGFLGIVSAVVLVALFVLKMKDYQQQKESIKSKAAGNGPVSVNDLELAMRKPASGAPLIANL